MSDTDAFAEIRALGGRIAIRQADGGETMLLPHEALEIAQRLISAAADAEGQKLLLRDLMRRGPVRNQVFRH